jgi:hypothetical protein
LILPAITLRISRVIIDELHELEAKRRDAAAIDESASRLPPRRESLVVQ